MPPEHALATGTGVALDVSDVTLQAFLDEDLGVPWRDVTSDPLVPDDAPGSAVLVAREPLVASGIEEAVRLFHLVGAEAAPQASDGAEVDAGSVLLTVSGPARAILRGERTALNLVGRMSAIATHTRRIQRRIDAVSNRCRVAATRKTTPGFRVFEKRAVLHGGGDAHRFGLFDQILVKDNHLAAVGDLSAAILRLRAAHPDLRLEVEVETLTDAETAARCGADIILVDNQTPEAFARFAERIRALAPRALLEASGGIDAETAADYAPHADRVSLGTLTMGAPPVDVGLDWLED